LRGCRFILKKKKKIYDLLKPDSLIHIDDIVERSGLSVSEVLSELLKLELNGMIDQSPGKYFQRKL
jgi:DNA processing protein